jgi:hypothetical protein
LIYEDPDAMNVCSEIKPVAYAGCLSWVVRTSTLQLTD